MDHFRLDTNHSVLTLFSRDARPHPYVREGGREGGKEGKIEGGREGEREEGKERGRKGILRMD